MAEYIEREKLLEKLHEVGGCGAAPDTWADGYDKAIDLAYDIVQMTPAADVAEVKRGKWIYHECVSSYDGTISGHSCSVCRAFVDEETFDNDTFYKKYCGNCGARMDGEGE